MEFDIDKK